MSLEDMQMADAKLQSAKKTLKVLASLGYLFLTLSILGKIPGWYYQQQSKTNFSIIGFVGVLSDVFLSPSFWISMVLMIIARSSYKTLVTTRGVRSIPRYFKVYFIFVFTCAALLLLGMLSLWIFAFITN